MSPRRSALILNAGSSSLKFAIYKADSQRAIVSGQIGGIGDSAYFAVDGRRLDNPVPSDVLHCDAFELIFKWLQGQGHDPARLDAFGHRIVHGGDLYSAR